MEIKDETKKNVIIDILLDKVIDQSETIQSYKESIDGLAAEKDEYKKEVHDRFCLSTTIGKLYGDYADHKISVVDLASKIAEASSVPFEVPEEAPLEDVEDLKKQLAEKDQEIQALRERVKAAERELAKPEPSEDNERPGSIRLIKAKLISETDKYGITWLQSKSGAMYKIQAPYIESRKEYAIPVDNSIRR